MSRRRFEHLRIEISVAVGIPVPRYPLWLRLKESGMDPEALTRSAALAFCRGPLADFLAAQGLQLAPRRRRRLLRSVARFDADHLAPEERFSGKPA
jgi:hypothetical protein